MGDDHYEEINVKKLPKEMVNIVKEIISDLYNNFDNPVFSIDLGMSSGGAKLFEINGTLGFPNPKIDYGRFTRILAERINQF